MNIRNTAVVFIGLILSATGMAADVPHNARLGEVMGLLSDTASGIVEFSKKTPATLEVKDFGRPVSRAGGADFLLSVMDEKKGALVDGKLVVGELTPGKFTILAGAELEQSIERYHQALAGVRSIFAAIRAEVAAQGAKAPADRNFQAFKRLLLNLDDAMKKAHGEFKPQH